MLPQIQAELGEGHVNIIEAKEVRHSLPAQPQTTLFPLTDPGVLDPPRQDQSSRDYIQTTFVSVPPGATLAVPC